MPKITKNKAEFVIQKKIEYILLRFENDSKNLNHHLKLELIRRWISSCVIFEEYEMAAALKEKKLKIIQENKKIKSWMDKLKIRVKLIRRFIVQAFYSRLSRK